METKSYKLEEIAHSFYYGSMPQEKLICDNGYPIFTGYRYTGFYSEYNVPRRSIVVVARGVGGTGDVRIAEEKTFLTNLSIAVGIDTSIADLDYLKYYLNIQGLRYLDSGAAQSQITINSLKRHRVFLPEITEQKTIVAVLSAYDNLIETNNKRIKVLEQMAENLYKEWFVRFRFPGHETTEFENGIPKGWRIDSVKETFTFYDTVRVPLSSLERDAMKKIYPYYGAAELMDYVDDYLFDGIYLLLGEDGSVITPNGKPMLQYVWGKFWVNNHAHILQGKAPFSTEYIHLMFKHTDITGIVTGSAQPKISQGRLIKQKTIIPSGEIVEQFNRYITPLYNTIRSLAELNKSLIKQRDLLLPRLMSGKLEV